MHIMWLKYNFKDRLGGAGAKPSAGKFFEYFDKNNASSCENFENFAGVSHGPIPTLAKLLIAHTAHKSTTRQ